MKTFLGYLYILARHLQNSLVFDSQEVRSRGIEESRKDMKLLGLSAIRATYEKVLMRKVLVLLFIPCAMTKS